MSNNSNITNIIMVFVNKIMLINNSNVSLDKKINGISLLINGLINFFVMKKISHYAEKSLSLTFGFSDVANNFKIELSKNVKRILLLSNKNINLTILDTYISNVENKESNNDINLNTLNKYIENSKNNSKKNVSFSDMVEVLGEDYNEIDINENNNINYLPYYIKILLNDNKYISEFTDKISFLCKKFFN